MYDGAVIAQQHMAGRIWHLYVGDVWQGPCDVRSRNKAHSS